MVQERPVRVERRLSAILAADVAGYSRLMHHDEEATHAKLTALLTDAVDPAIAEHGGRIVKNTGDGFLAEFPSAVEAVRAAMQFQTRIEELTISELEETRIAFRVGVNIGDVIVEPNDIFGDGVNIAARLENIAEPSGICISSYVYDQVRGKVGVKFTDLGEQTLKNIARPVRAYAAELRRMGQLAQADTTSIPLPATAISPPALPNKPSIAVLPFQNLSGDPEQEYFVDGMVEEITTALARIRWLFVIARNSSFTYKGRAVDVVQVGRELGVLYLLEGSLRKAGKHVRITAQLIDATTGAHLWADNFDAQIEDIFELQDTVASRVAGVIEPTLQIAEYRRAAQRPTDDLTAYDLYLRARTCTDFWERQQVERALELVGQALGRDPNYASALAVATTCQVGLFLNNWVTDLKATRDAGIKFARRALRVAEDDPYILANAAYALGLFGEDIGVALALMDRALHLNPNFAWAWVRSGWLRLWAGEYGTGIKHCETSIRLSPRESRSAPYLGIGMGYLFTRRLEDAAAMLRLAIQEKSNWAPTYRFLASCYAHMGQLQQAQEVVKHLREITPVVIPGADHWRIREDREYFLNGLRLAAGERVENLPDRAARDSSN